MRGVITLMGNRVPSEGRVHSRLQSRVRQAPVSIQAGIRERWLLVPMVMRARWGTARPRKEMGPQKAVVVAVSSPVQQSSRLRVAWMR